MSSTPIARSAIVASASAASTASSSARSSGDSEIPPEHTASFRSGRACPERISARTSAFTSVLMGFSCGSFQIISREFDAPGCPGWPSVGISWPLQFEHDAA